MAKSKFTDLLCLLLSLLMILTVLLFRRGEELGIEKTERENVLSSLSASAVIALSDEHIHVKGSGAYAADGVVTIAYGGEYTFTGSLSDGRIIVDADSHAKVKLIFDGAEIHCEDGAAIWVKNAGRTTLTTAKGSKNALSCGEVFSEEDVAAGVNGAVCSQDDLVLSGKGSMSIAAPGCHGIAAKDDLKLEGGEWRINAAGDGIRGKDSISATGGEYTVRCGEDGIKSFNAEDSSKGFILISGGSFSVDAGQDGIQAVTELTIEGGTLSVTTGGGAPETLTHVSGWIDRDQEIGDEETKSAKGIKCDGDIRIGGAALELNCSDDAVHCGGSITVEGGSLSIASGDDALHADTAVYFRDGALQIKRCMEGIEAPQLEISGGTLDVLSLNDGLNANGMSRGINMSAIRISGGTIHCCTQADGMDSNGDIIITGGVITLSSEPGDGNSAVDYGIENGGSCLISGGSIVACGFAGMAETFGTESEQCSLLYVFEEALPGGTEVALLDDAGRVLLSHSPENVFDCVIFSCPEMTEGGSYTVRAGDTEENITLEGRSVRSGSDLGGRDSRPGMPPEGEGFPGFPQGGFGSVPQGGFGDMPMGAEPPEKPQGGMEPPEKPQGGMEPPDGMQQPPEKPEGGMEPPGFSEGNPPPVKP